MSDFEDDLETKKSLQFEAHEVAKKCAMLFSDSYLAHKWLVTKFLLMKRY